MNQKMSPRMGPTNKVAGEPLSKRSLKVPEALPTERIKESALDRIKSAVFRKKTTIQSIVREPTSGGIIKLPCLCDLS